MWCPPTPPQDKNDIYIDYSLTLLYEHEIIPESRLPAVYVKKDYKRNRTEAGFFGDGVRRPLKIRKDENICPPRSLFDRPSPALAKLRRDLKLQRYRGIFNSMQLPVLKPQQMPIKPLVEPEGMAEWYIYEDMAILKVIQNLQGLPLNLMILSPGHTPNWDLVSDIVNQSSRTYRSPKQCRYRYEAVIIPREEGKLLETPIKKQKQKSKNPLKNLNKNSVRSMRTSQLFSSDTNSSFCKLARIKIDNVKTAFSKKQPQLKQVLVNPTMKNPKNAALLAEFGITNYDNPPSPLEIAARRVERMTKEKQKNAAIQQTQDTNQHHMAQQQQQQPQQPQQQPQAQQQPQLQQLQQSQQQLQQLQQQQPQHQQQIQQHIHQHQIQQQQQSLGTAPIQQTTIVVQQQPQQNVSGVTALLQSSPRISGHTVNLTQQGAQQIVKLTSNQQSNQGINVSNQQQAQQIISQHQPGTVSVVLTTPVTTMSSGVQMAQPHIVSLHQSNIINNSSAIVHQTSVGTLVQTLATQSLPQVVSVSQLANVISTASLSSGQQMGTINQAGLRTQRIVAAPGGTLQEVVLHQRPGGQNPSVVSVSGLGGQPLTQAQLQAQLRLSMSGGQQVSGILTKSIPVNTVMSTGKPTNSPQIQFYRQPIRQQVKVLHTTNPGGGTAVVQTVGGQTALVGPTGAILQGGIVQASNIGQTQGGQKVTVASMVPNVSVVGSTTIPSNVTSVATVQVAPGHPSAQFLKQVQGNKSTITRQVSDTTMQVLMKRQMLTQQSNLTNKPQILSHQMFTPANIQVQQAGTSGQQQITTLVKTTGGATSGTVGMTLAQVKGNPQIKATMANPNQIRQMHLQQQIALAQQRKNSGNMAKLSQVAGKGVIPTQLIVQNQKSLPGTVTVQQIQQVMRQPGTLATTGQIVLGKNMAGRVIPVSVTSQPRQQTIQVCEFFLC